MKDGEKNITTSRRRAKIFLKRFKPNNIRKSEVLKWKTVIYNKKRQNAL